MRYKQNIKPGYQLHISSWENDGDNSGLVILSGLTKEDVEFYLELLPYFRSGSNNGGVTFGNSMDDEGVDEKVIPIFDKIVSNHPNVSPELSESLNDIMNPDNQEYKIDYIRQFIGDLIGYSEYYTYRVFHSVTIYYFPEEIRDVTSEFNV